MPYSAKNSPSGVVMRTTCPPQVTPLSIYDLTSVAPEDEVTIFLPRAKVGHEQLGSVRDLEKAIAVFAVVSLR